jgi:hypothetical protein
MENTKSLDEVVANISEFNDNYTAISESLKDVSGTLETAAAEQTVSELSAIIEAQGEMSVSELKKSRASLSLLKDKVTQSDRISSKDRENILSLISNQEQIIAKNTTLSKRAAQFIGENIKDKIPDFAAITAGVVSESPALALGIKFVGDKIQESRERRKEEDAERQERLKRIDEEQRLQDEEYSILRDSITNQDTLKKLNMSEGAAMQAAKANDLEYQEYLDQLKNGLIRDAKNQKREEDLQTAKQKQIDEIREKYGVTAEEENTPVTKQDSEFVSDTTESVSMDTTDSGNISASLSPEFAERLKNIESNTSDANPHLESIKSFLEYMSSPSTSDDVTPFDIEANREGKRAESAKLKELIKTNQLLEQLVGNTDELEKNTEEGGGSGDGIMDKLGGLLGGKGGKGIFGKLKGGLGKVGGLLKGGLGKGLALAGGTALGASLISKGADATSKVKGVGANIADKGKSVISNAKVSGGNVFSKAKDAISGADIKSKVSGVADKVGGQVNNISKKATPIAQKGLQKMKGVAGGMADNVGKLAGGVGDKAKSLLKGGTPAVLKEAGEKVGKKAAGGAFKKVGKKGLMKAFAKAGGKLGIKAIPLVGAVAGGIFALGKLLKGDFTGAALEAGGVFVPGPVGSVTVDAAIMARDMYSDIYGSQIEDDLINNPELAEQRFAEIKDFATDEVKNMVGVNDAVKDAPPAGTDTTSGSDPTDYGDESPFDNVSAEQKNVSKPEEGGGEDKPEDLTMPDKFKVGFNPENRDMSTSYGRKMAAMDRRKKQEQINADPEYQEWKSKVNARLDGSASNEGFLDSTATSESKALLSGSAPTNKMQSANYMKEQSMESGGKQSGGNAMINAPKNTTSTNVTNNNIATPTVRNNESSLYSSNRALFGIY